MSARDLEDDVYIVDINNGYIELPYGKRAISPENSNAMIRQRRKDRLNTEWGWYAIGAVVLSIAKLWTKKIKTENPYAPTRGVAESIPAARESRLSDYEIFRDHVFEKCALTQEGASELNARTQKRFSGHIEDTIDHPAQEKALSGGRRTYRGGDMNVVVIKNPGTMDGAAAFQPLDGRAYFEGLR
ncbi:hypothetical protein [Varunaivibrio sulfuroxidans]|uniref:hypothetical protein n=1 Tax=Varunaivibrio sulfuroxidans TaxID=1773489 RepID=UPI00104CA6B2|nr:hypothetical protein [Varunaivibrio sulfuroxidans]WES32014.1 hypothetical protein P3M64_06570 [Varunaivibrio sulfuroxidans]